MRGRDQVADEDVGIRAHLTARDRAVQRAVGLVRHACPDEWASASDSDIELLTWGLGEMWAASPHGRWEKLRFTRTTPDDFRRMLALSKRLRESYSLWLLREMETLFTRESP